MLIILWILAFIALALWSLGAWAVHALLQAGQGWVGGHADRQDPHAFGANPVRPGAATACLQALFKAS